MLQLQIFTLECFGTVYKTVFFLLCVFIDKQTWGSSWFHFNARGTN